MVLFQGRALMMALTKWTAAESVDQKVHVTKMAAQMAHLLVTLTETSLALLTEMRMEN